LSEDEPDIVRCMLQYLYTSDYKLDTPFLTLQDMSIGGKSQTTLSCALITHAKVYIMADRNDIPGLKVLAKLRYTREVSFQWTKPTFITSLGLIYENTVPSDSARSMALTTICANIKVLQGRSDWVELLRNNADIACDVLDAILNQPAPRPLFSPTLMPGPHMMRCTKCYNLPGQGSQGVPGGYGPGRETRETSCPTCSTVHRATIVTSGPVPTRSPMNSSSTFTFGYPSTDESSRQ
jgi:hypothetical protein